LENKISFYVAGGKGEATTCGVAGIDSFMPTMQQKQVSLLLWEWYDIGPGVSRTKVDVKVNN